MSSYELKKMEDVKINNDQAAELAERTAEVFQLRQELQLLRHEVAQSRLAVHPVTNTVKFNISRKSYWAWTGLRGLWREKQSETTSEMLQTFYQQNLNQSRYVSLRNFLGIDNIFTCRCLFLLRYQQRIFVRASEIKIMMLNCYLHLLLAVGFSDFDAGVTGSR